MELVSRLTEQPVTPGTLFTAFSTRAEQAAQLIPVTLYCSIVFTPDKSSMFAAGSLHKPGQQPNQLVQLFVAAGTQVIGHTGAHVLGQQLLGKAV